MTISYEQTMNLFSVQKFKRNNDILLYNGDRKEIGEPASIQRQKAESSFQSAMKVPIIIAQCFGLFPVIGISGTDASKLSFTFCSGRFLYSLISTVGQTILIVFNVMKILSPSSSFIEDTSIIFYTMTTVTGLLFFRLATKWPKLCKLIAKTEAADPVRDKNLTRNCKIACILVFSLAAVEHILSDISGLALAIDCQPNTPLYDAYLLQSYPFVWTFIPYNPVIGSIIKILSIQCTFNWNFGDAFVICISLYLTSRLQQISDRIIAVRGQFAPVSFYRTLREDYNRIISIIRKIDDNVNGVIFVSYAVNLFIICQQLLHALEEGVKQTIACHSKVDDRPMHGYEQAVYFLYSFSFLLMRSLAVSLIASKVHAATRTPAEYLHEVPSPAYCNEVVEVQRFINQVLGDDVALTGLQFFKVKRGLVLTITGTIITYELVLMQVTGVTPTLHPATVATPT